MNSLSVLALTGDRAAIRVWCSHIRVHLSTESKSGHATDDRLRRVPGRRKKSKNRSEGGVCLLTKGVLIRVRLSSGSRAIRGRAALQVHWIGVPLGDAASSTLNTPELCISVITPTERRLIWSVTRQ